MSRGTWGKLVVAASMLLAMVVPAGAGAAYPTDPQADEAGEAQPLFLMHVGEALDAAGPLQDVLVAPLDTGIDLQNTELTPRLSAIPGTDFIGPDTGAFDCYPGNAGTNAGLIAPDSNPDDPLPPDTQNEGDCSGHGTLVATVLGAAWNGAGGAGVAPNARFLGVRTCWDYDWCDTGVAIDALDFAGDNGVKVATISWNPMDLSADPVSAAAMSNAIGSHPDTLYVANSGFDDHQGDSAEAAPCSLPQANVLCVAGSDPDGTYGCGETGSDIVDIAVPPRNMYWSFNGGGDGTSGDNCYQSVTAVVAGGLATILRGAYPQATAVQIKQAIIQGATPVPVWTGFNAAAGVADALGALNILKAQFAAPPPPPAPAPNPVRTGKRAAALKRCKKVKIKKARKRCAKRALKLPL